MDIFFACTILINTVSCFIALICAASVIQGTASRQTKLMNADVRRSLALSRATVYLIARGCVHLRYIGAEIAVNSAAVLLRVLVSGSNERLLAALDRWRETTALATVDRQTWNIRHETHSSTTVLTVRHNFHHFAAAATAAAVVVAASTRLPLSVVATSAVQ